MTHDAPVTLYTDLIAVNPELQRVREVAFAALRLAPGQSILDLGCGGDATARVLATRLGGTGEVVWLDYHREDLTSLPYPADHFDAAHCERVLQTLLNPDLAIAELARVTRPGGRLCLVDTDWESVAVDGLPAPLVADVRHHLLSTVVGRHLDMGRTLRRRLLRAGLQQVTAVPVALYFADPISAATVLPMLNPTIPPDAGLIPPRLRDDWFSALSTAATRGDFLATLTMWVATAVA